MSEWLNNKKQILKKVIKPCLLCFYCPYGTLVEEFPLRQKRSKYSCRIFGHDCPAYYMAEPFRENERMMTFSDMEKMLQEFEEFWNDLKPKRKTTKKSRRTKRKNK